MDEKIDAPGRIAYFLFHVVPLIFAYKVFTLCFPPELA